MLSTLQRYVGRELLKSFGLTAIGLTLIFSLCGGLLNMIQAEVLTAVQMVRIMMFILPVALTMTLPVAALFACAMVYGRFAADNEIDACRASGINIHRILWPAMCLSIFTALFTFVFANYILPTFAVKLEALVRKDLDKIVVQSLNSKGYIRRGPYLVYSRHAEMTGEEGTGKVVNLQHAAFLELAKEDLKSCGTADEVRVQFNPPPPGGNPSAQAWMAGVRGVDFERKQFYQEELQPIAAVEIPSTMREKPKWLTLPQLLGYHKDVTAIPAIRDHTANLRQVMCEAAFYKWVAKELNEKKVLQLADGRTQYEVRAERVELDSKDMKPELLQVRIKQATDNLRRDYKADRCLIRYKRALAGAPDTCQLQVRDNVSFVDARDPKHSVEKAKDELAEVAVPSFIAQQMREISDRTILGLPNDPAVPLDYRALISKEPAALELGGKVQDSRVALRKELARASQLVLTEINSRLAFSAGPLVMLVLAAALGITLRGGQLLTAFVISFVPGLLVVVMNIMGRQLSLNVGTQMAGLLTIWSGVLLLGIADVIVLTKFLKR